MAVTEQPLVELVKCNVIGDIDDKNKYTEYTFNIYIHQKQHQFCMRYSELHQLHELLSKQKLFRKPIPSFPSKNWFTDFTKPQNYNRRAGQLLKYLNILMSYPAILNNKSFQDAINLPHAMKLQIENLCTKTEQIEQLKMYQQLIMMGYNEQNAFKISKIYPNDINQCINYLEDEDNDEKLTSDWNKLTDNNRYRRNICFHQEDHKCNENTIRKCVCFRRINYLLNEYKSSQNNNMHEIINNDKYDNSQLLDDFYHLMKAHSFDDIYHTLITKCNDNIIQCTSLNRNYRRRSDHSQRLKNIYIGCKSIDEMVTYQILDKIHCYFLHSYHSGLMVKNSRDNINIQSVEQKYDIFDSLQEQKHNKFLTESSVGDADDDEKVPIGDLVYDFGILYNYSRSRSKYNYSRYRNDPYIDSIMPPVYKKYRSLKEELLNLKESDFRLMDWFQVLKKAKYHRYQIYARFMTAERVIPHQLQQFINIKPGSIITMRHLVSIMIYCNYDGIQYNLRKTYRPLTADESTEEMTERHESYYHLGLSLWETVNMFGKRVDNGRIKSFYHGIDKEMLFTKTVAEILGPISTSSEASVAFAFARNNGIVLRMTCDLPVNTKYFDCQFVSDYPAEKELFFIGRRWNKFVFQNIFDAQSGDEYKEYLIALNVIHRIIDNDADCKEIKTLITAEAAEAILNLLKYTSGGNTSKTIPVYIKKLWNYNRRKIQEINVDIDKIYVFPAFLKSFLCNIKDRIIKLDIICWTFPNLKNILVLHSNVNKSLVQHIYCNANLFSNISSIQFNEVNKNEISMSKLFEYNALLKEVNRRIDIESVGTSVMALILPWDMEEFDKMHEESEPDDLLDQTEEEEETLMSDTDDLAAFAKMMGNDD